MPHSTGMVLCSTAATYCSHHRRLLPVGIVGMSFCVAVLVWAAVYSCKTIDSHHQQSTYLQDAITGGGRQRFPSLKEEGEKHEEEVTDRYREGNVENLFIDSVNDPGGVSRPLTILKRQQTTGEAKRTQMITATRILRVVSNALDGKKESDRKKAREFGGELDDEDLTVMEGQQTVVNFVLPFVTASSLYQNVWNPSFWRLVNAAVAEEIVRKSGTGLPVITSTSTRLLP
eukprot:GHVQ01015077.1.p1 GENE.GHVQ01015077.1~~GHVQ01015077.1.p1  ORF type:complete len:230 (+),score=45.54 GHVQ01015077.1:225-914(+)